MRKNQSAEKIQNGAFKKQVYTLGLCFCWFLTLFCLFCGNPNNALHKEIGFASFLGGMAFVFALVFDFEVNLPWLKTKEKYHDSKQGERESND